MTNIEMQVAHAQIRQAHVLEEISKSLANIAETLNQINNQLKTNEQ